MICPTCLGKLGRAVFGCPDCGGSGIVHCCEGERAQPEPLPYFECPKCGRRSYNPHDIKHRYCGACGFADDWLATRVPETPCPHCGKPISGASARGMQPKPGDITICLYCGEWNVFDAELKVRKPTDGELLEIGQSEEARRYRDAWVKWQRLKPRKEGKR